MVTRSQMRNQTAESSIGDAGVVPPKWMYASNQTQGKEYLRKRIEAYLPSIPDESLANEARTLLRNNTSSFPAMLSFVQEKLNIKSVRKDPNSQNKTYVQRVEFLEPFSVEMENEINDEIIDENLSFTNSPSAPNTGTDSKSITPHETLHNFCMQSFNSPMVYESFDEIQNGTRIWMSTVKHKDDTRVYGYGEGPTKAISRVQAAEAAVSSLIHSIKDDTADSTASKPPASKPPAPKSNETSVTIEADESEVDTTTTQSTPPPITTSAVIKLGDDDSMEDLKTYIQDVSKEVLETHFETMFRKTLDSLTELFDKRIKNALDEMMEHTINPKIISEVHSVTTQTATLVQNEVQRHTKSHISTDMKNRVVDAVAERISLKADTHCRQLFERKFKPDVDNLLATTTNSINTLANKSRAQLQSDYNECMEYVNTAKREIVQKGHDKLTELDTSFNKHVQNLESETQGHLDNIIEVAQSHQKSTPPSQSNQKPVPPATNTTTAQPPFPLNEEVVYTDPVTGKTTIAWVMELIDTDPDNIYYFIKFANGHGLHTIPANLKRHTIRMPAKRFSNVDSSQFQQPHQSSLPNFKNYNEPDNLEIKSFHIHFKAPLRSDDDVINFYNQLRSQGRRYNIHLIDINHLTPESDLCPKEIPLHARETMALAIYQRMQDENVRDLTYENLENCLQMYANTSDGYNALKELLRQVHPQLNEGEIEHNVPLLSQCDNNLFKLNQRMRNYFSQHEMQGRKYNAKQQSKMYLQNLDDEKYHAAAQQCLIDLNIATMMSEHVIQKQSLTFNALPTTVTQIAKGTKTIPTLRALTVRDRNQGPNTRGAYNNNRGAYRKNNYEAIQCKGCGQWGHRINKCNTIPKIATCIKYIEKNKNQTSALIKEYLRINDKNTKRSTVRLLQTSGAINDDVPPDQFLESDDVETDMMEVDFNDIIDMDP